MSQAPTERSAWLREPLLHFLVAGALIFLLARAFGPDGEGAESREIVVSEARVEALAGTFTRTWMRPPTREELAGLVEDYIAEEVYYREARAMGLDQDDTVIRRRLRQKLEFLSEDAAALADPGEAELQAYLAAHAARFALPPRLTFTQVYLDVQKRPAAEDYARRLLTTVRQSAVDPRSLGDATLLPARMEGARPQEIERSFGEEFARALAPLPVGEWSGPLRSAFGLHLVRIEAREPGASPTLAQVHDEVLREWQAQRQQELREARLATLRAKYSIRVDGPFGAQLSAAAPPPSGGR